MSTISIRWQSAVPAICTRGIVSIGNFDGVHCGHAHLLKRAKLLSVEHGPPVIAVTFDPHPLKLLRPEQFEPLLSTADDRAQWLHEAGADHVVILQTDASLLALSAREFFDQVICGNLRAVGLIEGPNFGFGRGREGNLDTLAEFCKAAKLVLEVVQPLQLHGEMVSSSRIRGALLAGDVASARRSLGRPYRLSGTVCVGQRRGQTLGFPTANLERVMTLIPGDGVYAVRAREPGAEHSWPAAANLGPNPTFGEQARKIEVHLIGFNGDLYGHELTIEFFSRLRDTRRFDSVDDLLNQIRADVTQVRERVT